MRLGRSQSNLIWIQFSSIILVLLLSYWETVQLLVEQWLNNDDFSHGLLVVPISAYLVWERRKAIKMDQIKPDWKALPILLAAVGLYVSGQLGAELFVMRFSMILFLIGTIWFLFGMQLIRTLLFPLLFLFMMLPLPGVVYRNLTFPLQILSSKWAVALLNNIGVLSFREGNIIDLGFTRLQVVEACNGLRFILPLLTLGVLFAFWKPKPLWKRLMLVISTIPISISANILRIGGTGIAAKAFGEEAAKGFFHGFSGWAVFMISFGVFFGLNRLLGVFPDRKRIFVGTDDHKVEVAKKFGTSDKQKAAFYNYIPIVVFMLLVFSAPIIAGRLENISPTGLKQPLKHFPLIVEKRIGQVKYMDENVWEKVAGSDYFMATYMLEDKAPIDFYVAFYEHQSKEGSYRHSPKYCLPGAGWFISSKQTRTISFPDSPRKISLPVSELIIKKDDYSQLVYFWYQGRNRYLQSEWTAKFWTVWDGMFSRRTDGSMVRIVSPITSEENPGQKRQTMDKFAIQVADILDREFLP